MLPSRYPGLPPPSSGGAHPLPAQQRKSRMEPSRMSGIPKLKLSRPGSMERLSEAGLGRKPVRQRSNSMDPPRMTLATGRPSREASVTKLPMNQRSRSQQSEGWSQMTPSRQKGYSRSTTTPMRTPSNDRSGRSWQNSLDRALAFVTAKDKRPISNIKWQKDTATRVNQMLEQRSGTCGPNSGNIMLMKPLTITRFVDIVSVLLATLQEKVSLDQTNYVSRLPPITKRLLYPGVVSKSWLKTVNTLHTYPSALALIAYITDIVLQLEKPVDELWLYADKDELSCLRRQHLRESWIIFQDSQDTGPVDQEYLQNLKKLLGNDDEKLARLNEIIEESKLALSDPAEVAAQEDERRRADLVSQLQEQLREVKMTRFQVQSQMDEACTKQSTLLDTRKRLEAENERNKQELHQLKQEVSSQEMTMSERARLLDLVDYANRVIDTKNDLVKEVSKMVAQREMELAASQKNTLSACFDYKKLIITLSTTHTDCAGLAVEEGDLMKEHTPKLVASALEKLRQKHSTLSEQLKQAEKNKVAGMRRLSQQNYQLEQMNAKLAEVSSRIERERTLVRKEREQATAENERATREVRELRERAEEQTRQAGELDRCEGELAHWEEQEEAWKRKLSEFREYVAEQQVYAAKYLEKCKEKRANVLLGYVNQWTSKLEQINREDQI